MNVRMWGRLSLLLGTFSLVLIAWLFLLNGSPLAKADGPNTLFVAPNGSGNACTQAHPCALHTALTQAQDGDLIYLAGGTYTGTEDPVISTTLSITLYGGWDGTPTHPVVRNPEAYPTTLDGESQRRVMYLQGPSTVVLDGFTIANGRVFSTSYPWQGAGLYARDVHLTLRNMTFSHNILDTFDKKGPWWGYGGGAYVEGGTLVIDHVTFSRNKAWSQIASLGGGLAVMHSTSLQVADSVFRENDAWHGGGLYVEGDTNTPIWVTMTNTLFTDNGWGKTEGRGYAGYAGGAHLVNAEVFLEDVRFQHNYAAMDRGALALSHVQGRIERVTLLNNMSRRVSGLYLFENSVITFTNAVVANNRTTGSVGYRSAINVWNSRATFFHTTIASNDTPAGLLLRYASVSLINTIIVSHTVGISVSARSSATLDHTLWGAGDWANGSDWDGDGTVTTQYDVYGDPAFVNPAAGDYHIQAHSAARDTGVDAGIPVDIDGEPRPFGPAPDIGADEWKPWNSAYMPYVPIERP